MTIQPTLYGDQLDAGTRSVLMLLEELQVDVQLNHVNLHKKEHLTPEYTLVCPQHTVPALRHGEITIMSSGSIMLYIMEHFGKDSTLYADTERQRYLTLDRMFFNATVLNRLSEDMFDEVRAKGTTDLRHFMQRAEAAFSVLEGFLNERRYMASAEHVTIADIDIMGTLTAIHVVFKIYDSTRWPKFVAWFQLMRQRLAFRQTMGPCALNFRAYVKSIAKYDTTTTTTAAGTSAAAGSGSSSSAAATAATASTSRR